MQRISAKHRKIETHVQYKISQNKEARRIDPIWSRSDFFLLRKPWAGAFLLEFSL